MPKAPYVAFVVPAVGRPALKRGELGAVVAACCQYLKASPGYTVTIRRNERHIRHSVHLRHTTDGWVVKLVPNAGYVGASAKVEQQDADLSDVMTVLRNLQYPIHQPQENT